MVVLLKKNDHLRDIVQSVFTKKSNFLKNFCNFLQGLSCGPTFVGVILECLDECFIEETFDLQHPFVVKKCQNFKIAKSEQKSKFLDSGAARAFKL